MSIGESVKERTVAGLKAHPEKRIVKPIEIGSLVGYFDLHCSGCLSAAALFISDIKYSVWMLLLSENT